MKTLSREALSYAVLLVILFGIAAVAVYHTIDFVCMLIPGVGHRQAVSLLIWILTLGFMLIAGAFGLWATQLAAQAEARRRVARFVDAMDYLQDGLLTVDRKGRITGSNPAARRLAPRRFTKGTPFHDVFACLSDEEVQLLLRSSEPQEIERRAGEESRAETLRFRSQPSEGLTLILLSDITAMNAQRQRNRRAARLQLIGQISRGVAHDFNNLLCAVSGHASLLRRLPPNVPESAQSVQAILQSVEKGSALAGHLLQLARTTGEEDYPRPVQESLRIAADSLRNSLTAGWQVEAEVRDLPPVALPGLPLEQLVLNLGLLATESLMVPGVVRISTALPGTGGLSQVGAEYAGIVLVSARPTQAAAEPAAVREAGREPGAILSVMRPLVEGAGGALHALVGADGLPIYRLALPRSAVPRAARPSAAALAAADLARYVASWTVVLAAPETKHKPLQDALQQYGARVRRVTDIASVLAYIEEERPPDAMILDDYVLLHEPRAVLLALIKLCPSAATVVLAPVSSGAARGVAGEAVFLPPTSEPGEVVLAMVEARTLAAKRRPRPA